MNRYLNFLIAILLKTRLDTLSLLKQEQVYLEPDGLIEIIFI